MDYNHLKVCVTGAAGNIAYSFLPLLCSGEVFGPRTTLYLTMLELPEKDKVLKGMLMELEDTAYPLLKKVESGTEPKEMFKDCDIVIFLGGAARQPGQDRIELLYENVMIFKEQGIALQEVGKGTCKCLVVANPCNTNCYILRKYCTKLPAKNFSSLSRLDHNRSIGHLSQKLEVNPAKVRKMVVWGNHSTLQYPDVTFCEVDGKKVTETLPEEYI
mmetsp:Transcript_30972/g.28168  ORF Transcript_30972/g.28168 Transcript_30972/m.28168 type:complete len:216 (+) Transcript_30972:72-719(+)